jgi:hypothetical protein
MGTWRVRAFWVVAARLSLTTGTTALRAEQRPLLPNNYPLVKHLTHQR